MKEKVTRAAISEFDWSKFDSKTDDEVLKDAQSDPDAEPVDPKNPGQWRRAPFARVLRLRLKLSQAEFSQRYNIPIGTLRDWEQNRKPPDAAGENLLKLIADDPERAARVLAS